MYLLPSLLHLYLEHRSWPPWDWCRLIREYELKELGRSLSATDTGLEAEQDKDRSTNTRNSCRYGLADYGNTIDITQSNRDMSPAVTATGAYFYLTLYFHVLPRAATTLFLRSLQNPTPKPYQTQHLICNLMMSVLGYRGIEGLII
jgi:hypothetical protein